MISRNDSATSSLASSIKSPEEEIRLIEQLQAIADPSRVRLLRLLITHPDKWYVQELGERIPLSQPAISHHLKILLLAQLVELHKQGIYAYYHANHTILKKIIQTLHAHYQVQVPLDLLPITLSEALFVQSLQAIADPIRLHLLTLLIEHPDEWCVQELCNQFTLAQSTFSHHLRQLRLAQLVITRKRGLYIYYTVNHSMLAQVLENLYTQLHMPSTT